MRSKGGRTAARAADGNPLQMSLWAPHEASPGWHVRISRRARRLSMRVFPGGRVEVVVPPGVGIPAIERFVSRHRDWAERRAREFTLLAPHGDTRRPSRVELALPGRDWQVAYETAPRASVHETDDGVLRVRGPDHSERRVSQSLLRWLSGQAAREFSVRMEALSSELGIDYAKLHLRRQRTRWPDDPRAVPPPAHEPLRPLLAARRVVRAALAGAGRRAAPRLAQRSGVGLPRLRAAARKAVRCCVR